MMYERKLYQHVVGSYSHISMKGYKCIYFGEQISKILLLSQSWLDLGGF